MAKKAKATNMIDGEKAAMFFKQYEDLEVERLALHSAYMGNAKSVREDKREVRKAAKDAGIPLVVFDAEIAERAWAKRREARLASILAIEDAALFWRELRAHFQEDASFIPANPPRPSNPNLGPDEEEADEAA